MPSTALRKGPGRLLVALVGVALWTNSASAQETRYVPGEPEAVEAAPVGWNGRLNLGASVSLSQNDNVVGRIEGTSFALGAQIDSAANYIRREHEWRNTLRIAETFTRTPAIPEFVKTNDEVAFESTYLYHLKVLPWFGPYAQFRLNTAAFPGYDERAEPVDYAIPDEAGGVTTRQAQSLRLTDPFTPLTLRQTLGLFAKPITKPAITVEFKAGFGALQTFADGQLAIDDDDQTAQIEVVTLDTFVQGGPTAGVIANGSVVEDKITYGAVAEAMVPVLNDLEAGDDRNAAELTNVNLELKLSTKVFSWMSLDYQFRAVREPQLREGFQIQNNILLNFSYALIKGAAPTNSSEASDRAVADRPAAQRL